MLPYLAGTYIGSHKEKGRNKKNRNTIFIYPQ